MDVHFGVELVGFTQNDTGVHATMRTADGERIVTAEYLVGCGGGSTVREALGIGLSGPAADCHLLFVLFRRPELLAKSGLEPFRHYYLASRDHGVLVAQDDLKRWALHLHVGPNADPAAIDTVATVRKALRMDVDIEVLHVGVWPSNLLVANAYRDRRAFLAGDAAHQDVPTDGFGMNTGVGDADNLGWKLAAMLRDWGGEELLDSFHDERQPTGHRNCRAAEYAATGAITWRLLFDPSVLEDTPDVVERRRRLAAAANTYQRRSHDSPAPRWGSATRCHGRRPREHSAPRPRHPAYVPCASAGSRVAHLWVEPGVWVHDLLGQRHVPRGARLPTSTSTRSSPPPMPVCLLRSSACTDVPTSAPSTAPRCCSCGPTSTSRGDGTTPPSATSTLELTTGRRPTTKATT